MYAASLKWISLLYLTTVFCNSNAQCKAEVTVLLVNATTVNITWTLSPCSFNDSSSHTTNYYLRWRLEGLCSSTESYQNIFIVNETFYILTGLKEDSEYSVYVDTQYYNGTLKSSDEKCFNTAQGSDNDRTPVLVDTQCIVRDCNMEENDQTTDDNNISTNLQLWVKIVFVVVSSLCILTIVITLMHCYCTRPERQSKKTSKIFVDTALWGADEDDDKIQLSENPTMHTYTSDSYTGPQETCKQPNIVTLEAAHPMLSVPSIDYEPHQEDTLYDDAKEKVNLELDSEEQPTATTFEPMIDLISIPLIQSYTEEDLYDDAISAKETAAMNKQELVTEEQPSTNTFKPLITNVVISASPPIEPYTEEDLYDDAVSAKETAAMNKQELVTEEQPSTTMFKPLITNVVISAPPPTESYYTEEGLYDDAVSAAAKNSIDSDSTTVENTVYADVASCKKEAENAAKIEPLYEETQTTSKGKALITIQDHQYTQLSCDKSTIQQEKN